MADGAHRSKVFYIVAHAPGVVSVNIAALKKVAALVGAALGGATLAAPA